VETAPIMVSWIAPPAATPAPPQPSPPKPQPTPVKVTPKPRHVIAAAPTPTPTPAPAFTAPEPAPEPQPAPDTSGSNGNTTSNAPPAAPPAAPPGPQMVSASALRYLILPHQVYPMASRHLREAGIVYVKVVVDIHGLPKSVTIYKSSGFSRLDNQALDAMREARFQPYRVNGQPVESMAIAPLAYELQ
jgi:periplasmic protein TonB